MKYKIMKFRAATTEDAMVMVRRDLGKDAVVIEVNEVKPEGMFSWLTSRREVEVKASAPRKEKTEASSPAITVSPVTTVPVATHAVTPREPIQSTVGTIAAAAAAKRMAKETQEPPRSKSAAGTATMEPKPNEVATEHSGYIPRFQIDSSPSYSQSRFESDLNSESIDASKTFERRDSSSVSFEEKSRWHQATVAAVRKMEPMPPYVPVDNPIREESRLDVATIEQRLITLQQMIAELGQKPKSRASDEIPPELFPLYLTLVESDVDDEIARELIQKLQRIATSAQLADIASATALLTVLIEQRITCADSLLPQAGRRKIAMVVGPTGVGKTTTLAKLAGCLGVERGLKLGLVTVDTYRVAAVEQLRTYAEIIDLPMRVINGSRQVQDALDSLADRDLILIDTAGRSPHDDRRLAELKQLIQAAQPDHVYLVLSLATGSKALRNAAERFTVAEPTSVVFTKVDETAGYGTLLTAARDIGLPISYLTTGQEVPRDIEPANPSRAARLILGTDHLSTVSQFLKASP